MNADHYLGTCVVQGCRQSTSSPDEDFCDDCKACGCEMNYFGRCYHCHDGDHELCIGVPCQCECPSPNQRATERLRQQALSKLTPQERAALGFIVLVFSLVGFLRPAHAQLVVHDPGNLAKAALIAERTLAEYRKLKEQYDVITLMSQRLGNMEGYRIPSIPTTRHDSARYVYGRPIIEALNSGDPRGQRLSETVHRLPRLAVAHLPANAQRAVTNAYAGIEIADSVLERGIHQVALIRGYAGRLGAAVQALEEDVTHPRTAYHYQTAILDKIAGAELIGRRQDVAVNQLLSHSLEQLLLRNIRQREVEAEAMAMRLVHMREGRNAGRALLSGIADDLRTWRQP